MIIKKNKTVIVLLFALVLGMCGVSAEETGVVSSDSVSVERAPEVKPFYIKRGTASWYGKHFNGRRTASGERFNKEELTCAHRWLPFGSLVRVTNTNNGESVIVRVNDRGPYIGNRIIDLSDAAAREIDMFGCATVVIEAYADTLYDALYADTQKEMDSVQECPAIIRENTSSVAFIDLAAIAQLLQTNERSQAKSIIVDYCNRPVSVHGYTVLAAVVHDYKTAIRIRDALLARGFRTVHLRVCAVANETHFEVCVGLEPVAIACEMIQEQLTADYPMATITYIESKHDDTYQTTACAD